MMGLEQAAVNETWMAIWGRRSVLRGMNGVWKEIVRVDPCDGQPGSVTVLHEWPGHLVLCVVFWIATLNAVADLVVDRNHHSGGQIYA
jgi:hypothetical protein